MLGIIVFTKKLLRFTPTLGPYAWVFYPAYFGIFLAKENFSSWENFDKLNSQDELKLGWLDFTKFGIFLGIWLFTKKIPILTHPWDLRIFSCDRTLSAQGGVFWQGLKDSQLNEYWLKVLEEYLNQPLKNQNRKKAALALGRNGQDGDKVYILSENVQVKQQFNTQNDGCALHTKR